MCHALIDADILVYRIGFATNDDDADMAISTMASYIEDILMVDLPEAQTWELFLTGTNNFRKEKAVTAPYKGNRKSEKPVHYTLLRDYLQLSWGAYMTDGIEADDMLAIRATELGEDSVIVTLDKDLDQVVGWHYNFAKKNKYFITKDEGLLNFYKQFLVGDRTDNIIGVKGIGDKKAHKLLEGQSEPEMWKTVVEHLGEERAIENGHLLYMLRHPTDSFAPPV
jgi:5'-3' exonuclease